ncbi:MAG: hypothetical protein LH606_22225 [Cytophagaceae bacterium]|nr:hypothetical protein [Cytophagaceae bacterium]
MKVLNLCFLLLLTSLRLVVSPVIVGEQAGKKAVVSTQHTHQNQDSGYAGNVIAEESQEDVHGDEDPLTLTIVPAFQAWLAVYFPSSKLLSLTESLAANRPSQPFFVLFQNFRI